MKFRFWSTDAQLKKENKQLKAACIQYRNLARSVNQTLQFNAAEAQRVIEDIRTQSLIMLGGITLQHQGEILIKDDFMQMIADPSQRLQVVVERNKDDSGTFIRTVEQPLQEKTPDVEKK